MSKPKTMPVRTAEIAFDGIYEGFMATVRTNPSYATKLDLSSQDRVRFESALQSIIVAWNLADEAGENIPVGEFQRAPDDLLSELVRRWSDAITEATELPKV